MTDFWDFSKRKRKL